MDDISTRFSDVDDDIFSSSLESRKLLIDEILQYRNLEDDLFKSKGDDESEVSVLSLPFSDDSSVELHTKLQEEGITQFSSTYVDTMKEVDEESQDLSPPCSSCSLCSSCTTDTWEILGIDEDDLFNGPEDLKADEREEYDSLLKESDLISIYEADAEDNADKKVKFLDRKRRKKKKDFDPMSGIWKMLSTYDNFFVTPPGYNLYHQDKPHWLDRETVPWAVRERSRSKCANWLHRYHK